MAVLQALLTALLSGLVAGLASFALNEERDRLDVKLRKIEELATAAAEYGDFVGNLHHGWAIGLTRRTITKAAIISFSGSESDKRDALRTRLIILLRVWFPEGIVSYNKFNNKLSELIELDTAMFQAYDTPQFSERATEVHKAVLELIDSKNRLISHILDYGQSVASRPFILERLSARGVALKSRIFPVRSDATPSAPAPPPKR